MDVRLLEVPCARDCIRILNATASDSANPITFVRTTCADDPFPNYLTSLDLRSSLALYTRSIHRDQSLLQDVALRQKFKDLPHDVLGRCFPELAHHLSIGRWTEDRDARRYTVLNFVVSLHLV